MPLDLFSDDEAARPQDSTLILAGGRPARSKIPPDWVHCLVVVDGHEPGRRVVVGEQPLRIGRRLQLEWPLLDPQVSGWHCTVTARPEDANLLVTDENSTNGTFINSRQVRGSSKLARGALLQVGKQVLRHDHLPRRELEMADELMRDLDKARHYVESLLPAPIDAPPVQVQWLFQPSQQLGGDAFGYHWLEDGRFVAYLIDVSGHGAGAAMHSVSIMNVLRQHALPDTDPGVPTQVLERLNAMFQMDRHAEMYFSIWYGVFDPSTRRLVYASAGHHPSYLRDAVFGSTTALRTRNPVIGARPEGRFEQAETIVPFAAKLYLFSDGLYEVIDRDGKDWGIEDLRQLIEQTPSTTPSEPRHLFDTVRGAARPGPLDDDASIVHVTFL
jgi:serine phosphatase RsbU (regulator of sigma subunit)